MEFDFKNEFESMMKSNELDTVVVLGHINPDGDAAGSVMGIAHYIGVNYPEYQVFPYLADTIDKGPKQQVNQDKKFDPFEKPDLQGKRFATVICDTATLARLSGREFYEASVASIVIDHHASNEGYGDRNYTKVSEACAVNVFYSLNQDDLKKAAEAEEYPNAADYIYLGIVHDTNAFQRADESIMKAATKLLELGVDHRRIIQTRQIDTLEDLEKRADILKNAMRVLDGKVAYVCINKEEKVKKIQKVKASAQKVFLKMLSVEEKNLPLYNQMIAREISEDEYEMQKAINVQEFMECDEKLEFYLEEIKKIEKCFSKNNPWIEMFSEMVIPEEITRPDVKRWIDRVESFRYEKIEVQFKNREWKEMLPEEWFEEA